ncbi:MAG: glycosyltransferase, partial [Fluviibacter sp.]
SRVAVHMVYLTWGMEIHEFERMSTNLGIRDRVHFLNPVPWSEIVYWAASVDVGVMPYQALDLNTRISSPNKMYEFIAAGTPMIGSSELVNVAKVVPIEGFGVLRPLHVATDYAEVINEIFDPEQGGPGRFRANLIDKAHKYLWRAEASGFEAMYARLLNENYQPKARAA